MESDPRAAAVGIWSRSPQVLWRRTLDGVVVLAPRPESEPVALRGPAAEIWELLALPMRADELVAVLATGYGVDATRVGPDVERALDSLADVGALCLR